MLQLPQHYWVQIHQLLKKHVPHGEVWVYGSRIKNKAHEGSDLDLVVVSKHKNVSAEVRVLRHAFRNSQLPIMVDVQDWNQIPEEFQVEIQKQHEVIWPIPLSLVTG